MTHDEARIILLEDALIQAYHTMGFLYCCLEEGCKHAYPEQTLDRLKHIEGLVTIPGDELICPHSFPSPGCKGCEDAKRRMDRHYEARKILGLSFD